MQRICATCGAEFHTRRVDVEKGGGKFCSRACYYESKRGPKKPDVKHRMRKAKGHPIAPPSGTAAISRITLFDRIGWGPHPCHWCQAEVDWKPGASVGDGAVLVADHLDHDPTNDEPTNLVPSCNPCNAHRRVGGTSAIIDENELVVLKGSGKQRTRAAERACEACAASFLASLSQIRQGRGRFCSRSCARRKRG